MLFYFFFILLRDRQTSLPWGLMGASVPPAIIPTSWFQLYPLCLPTPALLSVLILRVQVNEQLA